MSVKFFFSSPLSNRFCFDSGFLYFNLTEIFPIVSLPANQSSTLPWRQLLSHVWLFVTPWTVACQAPLSMGFSRQEYWSGLPLFFSRWSSRPRNRTHISCVSCIALRFFTTESPGKPATSQKGNSLTLLPLLYTWTSPDGRHWNQIDYIFCSQKWRSCTQFSKSKTGSRLWLDHELSAKFRLKLKKVEKITRPLGMT